MLYDCVVVLHIFLMICAMNVNNILTIYRYIMDEARIQVRVMIMNIYKPLTSTGTTNLVASAEQAV